MFVLIASVFHELVFAIVTNTTSITHIWLLVCVSSLMVVSISNRSETFDTVFAFIRFFASMNSHVN